MISTIILYAKVVRIQALFLSFLPCILSYVYCRKHYANTQFNVLAFVFTCISFVLFNLAVNTISEYRDCINGVDDPHSPGTKYRLVTGIVPSKNVLILGIVAFIIASICGLLALYNASLYLLIPGIIGASIALFYSEHPFQFIKYNKKPLLGLKYKALGEICVFICYGLLLGFSTVLALTNNCTVLDIIVFIPGGLLITCVLLANNIRDYYFDLGKTNTLVTTIGQKHSYVVLYSIANLSFIINLILIYFDLLDKKVLYTLFAYPILLLSWKFKNHPKFINFFGILFFITEIIEIFALMQH